MKKKSLLLTVMIVAVLILGATTALANQVAHPEHMLGFSLPTYGTVHYDDAGNLRSLTGFNIGLGYSARYFTSEDGLKPNRFNGYWGWGTILFIVPYLEFGVSYPFEIANGTQYFVIDLGVLYLAPYIQFSVYF